MLTNVTNIDDHFLSESQLLSKYCTSSQYLYIILASQGLYAVTIGDNDLGTIKGF